MQHDLGAAPPVFVIVVEHDGHSGIISNVAKALQRSAISLRILVDGDVKHVTRQPETDWNDMRDGAAVGCRQIADPSRIDEVTFMRR